MFSKACEYGIKAVLFIGLQSLNGDRARVGDITEHLGIPSAFTGKILGVLARYNIVDSYTGPNGGFEMSREKLERIRISEIVRVIDGDQIYNGCVLGFDECNAESPCPMHHKIIELREKFKNVLESTTLFDLAMDLKEGKSILARV